MSHYDDNIRDDEFQVIGGAGQKMPPNQPRPKKSRRGLIVLILLFLLALIAILLFLPKPQHGAPPGVFESKASDDTSQVLTADVITTQEVTQPQEAYTERKDTVVNDIHLFMLSPRNAQPSLFVGHTNKTIQNETVLAMQAADIRKDTGGILGAFVLNGDLLAKGTSRAGFCSIIDGKITIGMAESTPLFGEAIEKDGFFFRQYPLVIDNVLINSGSKGKSIRKALCTKDDTVFIVVSKSEESFHDFSQALVDMGIDNAISLCGGTIARGWYKDSQGTRTAFGSETNRFENASYIVWD